MAMPIRNNPKLNLKMLINKTQIKVRYGETDQMGIVNNAAYPSWFEIGRTELFGAIKMPYGELEKKGTLLPLSELRVKYHTPALYEDLLTITTIIRYMPSARLVFDYEIHKDNGTLVASGETTHAFLDAQSRRPTRIPDHIKKVIEGYFEP